MHSETHRNRHLILILVLSLLAMMLLVRPAHSGWGAEPVEVHATSARCPLVSACEDGQYGAIVVWQENTATGGLLKAQHLLASGDVDPAWSAPAMVSTTDFSRLALGAVPDGMGGAYVWWMETAQLFLTHVTAAGAVDPAWPAQGRNLGTLVSNKPRPSAAGDGSGGIYLAWLGAALAPGAVPSVRAVHLGPANTSAGGWPSGIRVLGMTADAVELTNAAAIAAAPDGGLWLAFATTRYENPAYLPGDVRLLKVTSAGLPAPGWDAHGISLAAFRGDLLTTSQAWGAAPGMNLVSVAEDGASGAYVAYAGVAEYGGGVTLASYRLARIAADGSAASGWSPGGIAIPIWGIPPDQDFGSMSSFRTFADGRGGAFTGTPEFYSEGISVMAFNHWSSAGAAQQGGLTVDQLGLEYANRGDGGMYVASFYPSGPTSSWSPSAYVRADQSAPGTGYFEYHDTPVVEWYGDVGLTGTGDGGAIFVWSQVNERFGVFAVRLGPGGMVTGVPPTLVPNGPPSLRLRFVPGVGVRALLSSAPPGREELSLHDAAGRRVASVTIASASGGDWLFPGTERLPSGLYFARAKLDGGQLGARVAVVR